MNRDPEHQPRIDADTPHNTRGNGLGSNPDSRTPKPIFDPEPESAVDIDRIAGEFPV